MKKFLLSALCALGVAAQAFAAGTYTKATAVTSGKSYIAVADSKVLTPIAADKTYGYPAAAVITVNNNQVVTSNDYAMVLEAVEGGYTIKDSQNRYLYMTGNYNSFNVATSLPTDLTGYVWSVSFDADGVASIVNVEKQKTLQYDESHNNFAGYQDVTGSLPTLYEYTGEVVINYTGDGSKENPYTVTDLLNGAKPESTSTKVWTQCYIVGFINGQSFNANTATFSAENALASNLLVSATPDNNSVATVVPVALPSNNARKALNLSENPGNLGKEVKIYGTIEKYMGNEPGVKNVTDYEFVGEEEEMAEYATLAAWLAATPSKSAKVNEPVTAVYQNGSYLYITNGALPLLVYGTLTQKYNNGDVIPAGFTGSYKNYNGLEELVPDDDSFLAGTPGTPVEPEEIALEEVSTDLCSAYIKIVDATIEATDNGYTISDGTETYTLKDQFNNAAYGPVVSITVGTGLTVEAFVSVVNQTVQIVPVKITTASGKEKVATPVIDPKVTEINPGTMVTITCATPGATIYYTLDGTAPSAQATLYEESFEVKASCTVKAIAIAAGMDNSDIAEQAYTIKDPNAVVGTSATFDFTNPALLYPAVETPAASKGTDINDIEFTANGVKFLATDPEGAQNHSRIWNSQGTLNFRTYTGAEIQFTAPQGYVITTIEFTGAACTPTQIGFTEGQGTMESHTWTAPEGLEVVKFNALKTIQINTAKISFKEAEVSALVGDLNDDKVVNSVDLGIVINMIIGNAAPTDAADLNGDTIVNSVDLGIIINKIIGN